jgi:hypothetical protein
MQHTCAHHIMQSKFLFNNLLPRSTPYDTTCDKQDYNFEKAPRSILPDTKVADSLYPSLLLSHLYEDYSTIPLQFLTEASPSIRNCTSKHPKWRNWDATWKSLPVELDPAVIPVPTIENTFHGILLRIHLSAQHLTITTTTPRFAQGTIIHFKGDDTSRARYIVEWCEQVKDGNAYFKVVAVDKHQNPFPFNDPQFPSFILIVPFTFCFLESRTPIYRTH